jgi:CubicO group peptidase (beta-lactamase class C family)
MSGLALMGRGLFALATLGVAAPPQAVGQQGRLAGLDAYVERAMVAWQVPGLALAIVKDDSLVYAKGYGVREVGTQKSVDTNTVFGIMSMTKAFTATAMGMLVDEGRVRWDDRVIDHLPGFYVYNDWVTREVTIRDLLSHRMGVERGDFLWFGTGFTRDELVHHIRYLRPVAGFRAAYGYSNNMFITAGQLIAAVTGMNWDDVIRKRIFEPLGMTSSCTSVWELSHFENRASPHEELNGMLQPVPYRSLDNEAPGGSINSTVLDMARWARFQLAGGEFEGRRLISREALAETHAPQTLIPISETTRRLSPGIHFSAYGFGWQMQDYRGRKLIQHSGGIDGQRSRIALMPEENLGVVILTNRGRQNMLYDAIRNWVLDAYLETSGNDWSAEFLAVMREQEAEGAKERERTERERVSGTSPSLSLDRYTGLYLDSAYGKGRVSLQDGALVIEIGPEIRGVMEHWHFDTFRIVWDYAYLGDMLATFRLDAAGRVVELELPGWWPTFRRVADLVPVVGGPRRP